MLVKCMACGGNGYTYEGGSIKKTDCEKCDGTGLREFGIV